MADDAVFDQLAALEARRDAWLAALNPEAADQAITQDLAAFDKDATRQGIYIADADARARYEAGRRRQYDEARRAEAAALEADHRALLTAVTESTQAFQVPPVESNVGLDTMRELTALTRWQGRTLAALVDAYVRTPDHDNPTFLRLVETDRETFRLTADPATDLAALQQLQRTIAERQRARVPEGYREALPRAEALLRGLRVSSALSHIRTRGVADRPRSTTLHAVPVA